MRFSSPPAGRHRVLLLIIVLPATLLALACGDDDGGDDSSDATSTDTRTTGSVEELSLEDYFGELQTVFERADSQTDEAEEELSSGLNDAENVDDQLAVIDDYLTTTSNVFEEAIAEMEGLGAPIEVAPDHDEFLASAREALQLGRDLRADLADVETEDEAELLIEDFDVEVAAVIERADEACAGLQETADGEGIDVDLHCQD